MATVLEELMERLENLRDRTAGSSLKPDEIVHLLIYDIGKMSREFEEDARIEGEILRARRQNKED